MHDFIFRDRIPILETTEKLLADLGLVGEMHFPDRTQGFIDPGDPALLRADPNRPTSLRDTAIPFLHLLVHYHL